MALPLLQLYSTVPTAYADDMTMSPALGSKEGEGGNSGAGAGADGIGGARVGTVVTFAGGGAPGGNVPVVTTFGPSKYSQMITQSQSRSKLMKNTRTDVVHPVP